MKPTSFIRHRGARILVVDYSGKEGADLRELVEESGEIIRGEPEGSLLILTHAERIEFSPSSVKMLIGHITANAPYSRATAVVGLQHLSKAIPVANRLTGRNLEAFDDEEEALDWLASHVTPEIEPDEYICYVEHHNEKILKIDFRDASTEELLRRIGLAYSMIRGAAPRSVLGLTLAQGVRLEQATGNVIKEYVSGNRPYILAGAVVGVGYLRHVIQPLNRLTGRNLRVFEDVDSAKDWLVSEKKRHQKRLNATAHS